MSLKTDALANSWLFFQNLVSELQLYMLLKSNRHLKTGLCLGGEYIFRPSAVNPPVCQDLNIYLIGVVK